MRSVETTTRTVYFLADIATTLAGNIKRQSASTQQRLLDPTETGWATRFVVGDDHVMKTKNSADHDAEYTLDAYLLDSPRKAELRRNRDRRFADFRGAERAVEDYVPLLLEEAWTAPSPDDQARATAIAKRLLDNYDNALEEIRRYLAIPKDAPSSCRCKAALNKTLPAWLAGQLQMVSEKSRPI